MTRRTGGRLRIHLVDGPHGRPEWRVSWVPLVQLHHERRVATALRRIKRRALRQGRA